MVVCAGWRASCDDHDRQREVQSVSGSGYRLLSKYACLTTLGAEYWGISALNMFEDNGGTDNGLANWASQGSNMRISTLSPDSDVNSLWNAIEAEFDQTAATLQGMVDGTKGNTFFNVGTCRRDDDISAAEIADAAYRDCGIS